MATPFYSIDTWILYASEGFLCSGGGIFAVRQQALNPVSGGTADGGRHRARRVKSEKNTSHLKNTDRAQERDAGR